MKAPELTTTAYEKRRRLQLDSPRRSLRGNTEETAEIATILERTKQAEEVSQRCGLSSPKEELKPISDVPLGEPERTSILTPSYVTQSGTL